MFISEEERLVVIRFGPDWDETLRLFMIQSKQHHTEYKGGSEGKEFECLRNEFKKNGSMIVLPRLLNTSNSVHGVTTVVIVDILGSAAIYTDSISTPGSGVFVEISVSYVDAAYASWIDKEGKTPLISGRHDGTPLHHAAKRGLEQTIKLLLSHEGTYNCTSVLSIIAIERNVVYRERFAGMYYAWIYSFARAATMTVYVLWDENDGVARAVILDALANTLFDVYSSDAYSAKQLWEKLDQTHNTDSQGLEKYSVARFLEFKLVDTRSMTEQVHEFEMLVHTLGESGMDLPEKFKEQHKSKEGHVMPVEHGSSSKVNVVTVGLKRKSVSKKDKTKPKIDKNKAKKPKANKPCWSCGQAGHWSKDCPVKKAKKAGVVAQANTVLGLATTSGPVANMVVGEVVASKSNDGYVNYNPELLSTYLSNEWLVDTASNVHICANITLFVSYQQTHGVTVTMGNASAAQVLGIGNVDLKFASGRILSLTRVHHVPSIQLIPKHAIDKKTKCQHKDEALDKFIMFKNEAETQTGKVLKRLRSDRGGEYTSTSFNEFCASSGIVHEVTPPYTPESNGVAERKNITFKDMINNMLINSGLSKYMWGEDLNMACHILNRVPLKHMEKTPYELWRKRKTSVNYLRVWGYLTNVLIPEHKRKKLGPKTIDCIFMGYLETIIAMRILVLKSDIDGIVANTIVEFRDATFFEDVFPIKTSIPQGTSDDDPTRTSSSIPDHVEKMSNVGADPVSSSTPNEVEKPRTSKRARVVKDFGSDYVTYNVKDEPLTFRQAMDSSESRH
ncbi:hypothetical protein AgCh_017774 [Apium graveolens]